MRRPGPARWAMLSLSLFVLAMTGFGALATLSDDRPDHAMTAGSAQPDGASPSYLAVDEIRGFDPWTPVAIQHTPWRPIEEGKTPTKDEATRFTDRWSRFIAIGDEGLDKLGAEGHFDGAGTPEDPYIIERFYVTGDMVIQSVGRAIVLREGFVAGRLKLNYIGPDIHVHHVYAKDLRINENVRRSGDNTAGLFHDNRFGFVGQIRHFTGAFFDNTIGPRPANVVDSALGDSGVTRVRPEVVFNFDGFHGADVHHNTFDGAVDIKLHGHNHADCFLCQVHDHADPAGFPVGQEGYEGPNGTAPAHQHAIDPEHSAMGLRTHHSIRYHSLLFRDNTIRVPGGYALRYNDRDHAGDDRTADSEPNGYLEDPHVHYQDVTFARNQLDGGHFHLEVFNAGDDRHLVPNVGALRFIENTITVRYDRGNDRPVHGMTVNIVDGIELLVAKNRVSFEETQDNDPARIVRRTVSGGPVLTGFHMIAVQRANVTFSANTVTSGTQGVYAEVIAPNVLWELLGNDFRTTHEYRARSVEAPPYESDDPDATSRTHDDTAREEGPTPDQDAGHDDHGGH